MTNPVVQNRLFSDQIRRLLVRKYACEKARIAIE